MCAAIQDVLVADKALDKAESRERKTELDGTAAILSRLSGRSYDVREEPGTYLVREEDLDPDFDLDFEGEGPPTRPIYRRLTPQQFAAL